MHCVYTEGHTKSEYDQEDYKYIAFGLIFDMLECLDSSSGGNITKWRKFTLLCTGTLSGGANDISGVINQVSC